ncbi:MAG: dihydrodipicolinate synthase family protein [Prevotellaceae bacterium]|jgi:4-hydroxy-tetrahydrodipicolinate synthase|nr:dihydrodipicolinate synthase family protein [Prevotellaceae bacterium]
MIKYIAPTLTALHSADEIDIESCLKLYDYLIANNIDGIAVFGTSGEFPHIPLTEKKKLIKAASTQITSGTEYVVGTGTMNANETIALSDFAFENGADAVIVVSPYYYGMSDDSIFTYYSKVASEVKGNIYLYNFPDRTSYSIKPHTVLALAREHGNIIGIKDTIPDMGHTVDIIKAVKPEFPDFAVFSAYDNNFVYNILSGGNGCVAILANIAPKLFSNWVKAAKEKDFDTLADIQKKVDRLMDILWIYSPFLSTTKAILVDKGIFAKDQMTFPYLPFPEAKKQELRDFMKDFE